MNSMTRRLNALFLFLLLAATPVVSQVAQEPAAPPSAAPAAPAGAPGRGRGPAPPLPPATEPRPRDDARHQAFLEIARRGNIDLLFVGDSITDWWAQPARGLSVWNEYFASMKSANFGIAGDTTQGVIWRMQNGELE